MSNSDNLGAVLEPRILAWLAAERIPFLMEVADRTEADRKGGHLARRPDGRLLLREIAQTPEPDHAAFQDISRHRYFNTNTLWINLRALSETLRARGNVLGLPMIVNTKTVDPTDPSSPSVYQLETAMGAAIEVFEGARALRVPRERFAPVKTSNDLLVLRSDCYVLTEDAHLVLTPERNDGPPLVDLDPLHYKLLADFEARFPAGPPSLRAAQRFAVRGDVVFGAGVVVTGDVEVKAAAPDRQVLIDDGTVLEG
jgi:UTP--glucose-1-phosphate uridylyltransferase